MRYIDRFDTAHCTVEINCTFHFSYYARAGGVVVLILCGCGLPNYPRGANMTAVEVLLVVCSPFSRYLHATACSFRNVMKRKKAKHSPSTSPEAVNKIKTSRGKEQMSRGAAGQREATVSDAGRRRRAPDPLVWDAKTAEMMLLYKDGEFVGPFPNKYTTMSCMKGLAPN